MIHNECSTRYSFTNMGGSNSKNKKNNVNKVDKGHKKGKTKQVRQTVPNTSSVTLQGFGQHETKTPVSERRTEISYHRSESFNYSTQTHPAQVHKTEQSSTPAALPSLFDEPFSRHPLTNGWSMPKAATVAVRPTSPRSFVRGPLGRSIKYDAYETVNISPRGRSMFTASHPSKINMNTETPQIPIKIKKCITLFRPDTSHVPMYNTCGPKRGMSLIINNIDFDKCDSRRGANFDGINMNTLLKELKLEPKLIKNLRANDMTQSLKSFASNSKLEKVDMCLVVIMSHGNGSMNTMTEISGTDHQSIKVCDIVKHFSEDKCAALKGKPKIFIFQCCRGDNIMDEHDASPCKIPTFNNMLLAFSTMPGFVANRNIELGSYYIREICKVFMEHSQDTHLEDMLKKVDDNLKQTNVRQLTHYENLSFSNCYFNPV